MNNTHGDVLYSPTTTTRPEYNDLLYRQKIKDTTGQTMINMPCGEVGWICPVCGRGLAPSTSYCPCNLTRNITYLNGGLSIQDIAIDCKSTPPEAHYTTTAETATITTKKRNDGAIYSAQHDMHN